MTHEPAETTTEPDDNNGPMTVQCPCGWTATGPAEHVQKTVFHHRCEKTDPTWTQREREVVTTALRELLDQTYLGDEATDLAWKQHNARHALMFVDGDPRA